MHLKFLTPFFIILMTLSFFTVRAQEQIGLAQGNANVTEGVRLNPSFSADAKPWLDMHFGGGFGHFTNNYGFFSKENFNLYKFKFNPDFSTGSESPVWANGEARLTGPGFSLVSGNWSIGINSAVRVFGSARDVPVNMADNYWYDWQVDNQVGQTYSSGNFRVNGMSWMELGFNGSGIIRRRNNNMWTLGGTVKILRGINQTSFNIQQFDYSVPNDTTFQVSNMTGQYSTSPLNIFNGWGVSGDIGVTFKKMMKGIERYVPHSLDANCDHIDYHYRFGVSVLDVGYVNYTNETQVREIENGSATWDRRIAFVNNDLQKIHNGFETRFDGQFSNSSNSVRAWLPMAVSAQFDYNTFRKNIFLNVSGMIGIPKSNMVGVQRMSWIAFTPRIEKKRFEFSLPFSINQKGAANLGFGLRFWSLSLGVSNLLPVLSGQDIYHFGGYVHLKHAIFTSLDCKRGYKRPQPDWSFLRCVNPLNLFPKLGREKRKKQKRYLD